MVGPSLTDADRRKFLRYLQIGFALLVGTSMGLVTLYGGAELMTAVVVVPVGTAVGGLLAWYTFPDSIAETPYERPERGPKPGTRLRERRNEDSGSPQRATDGDGRRARGDRD